MEQQRRDWQDSDRGGPGKEGDMVMVFTVYVEVVASQNNISQNAVPQCNFWSRKSGNNTTIKTYRVWWVLGWNDMKERL